MDRISRDVFPIFYQVLQESIFKKPVTLNVSWSTNSSAGATYFKLTAASTWPFKEHQKITGLLNHITNEAVV